MQIIRIDNRPIGAGFPCYIIAEAGVNHNGSLPLALRLIDAAAQTGADAVKFQSFNPDEIVTPDAPRAAYQLVGTQPDLTQYQMLRQLHLPDEDFSLLHQHAQEKKLTFLSTPFDKTSVDFLDRLGVPAFKIASGEITNYPLLAHIAGKKKPVLLSTGMSSLEEVERAVTTLNNEGCNQLILLHCLSCYPADITEVNLRAILTLITEFGLPVGFSDHTLGIEIALAAIALGACVIEKHFTLDRGSPGPDHAASLLPVELRELVQGIRKVEASLGDGVKIPQPSEANSRLAARRSIVAERDIPPGELITENMLALRRPGTGIHPKEINQVIGKRAAQSIPLGTVIQWDMLT